jgi:hypothetical protein
MEGAQFVGQYQTKDKFPLVIDGPWVGTKNASSFFEHNKKLSLERRR